MSLERKTSNLIAKIVQNLIYYLKLKKQVKTILTPSLPRAIWELYLNFN